MIVGVAMLVTWRSRDLEAYRGQYEIPRIGTVRISSAVMQSTGHAVILEAAGAAPSNL